MLAQFGLIAGYCDRGGVGDVQQGRWLSLVPIEGDIGLLDIQTFVESQKHILLN